MKLVKMILPLSLLAVSGFAQDVRYNFDKGANFSAYKTYKWVKVKDAPQMNPLVDGTQIPIMSLSHNRKPDDQHNRQIYCAVLKSMIAD